VNTRLSIVTSLGALTLSLAGLTPACGSDSGGQQRGALLEGGAVDSGGAGGASNNGGAPNTGGSSGSASTTPIGQACLKDTDCSLPGLVCLLPTGSEFAGGGVSNGVCSLDCSKDITAVSASAPSTCFMVDQTATCLQVSNTQAFCVESCTPGAVPSTETKCHGRRDMACADPNDTGRGYCKPTCRGDYDCKGRSDSALCDLADGTCVDKIDPTRKLAAGSKCDPNAADDICEGTCVGILEGDASSTAVGFCSGLCKLGEAGCGVDITSTDPADAYCLFGTTAASDLGDIGFCAQLCDCNDDCRNPDFICSTVSGLSMQIGRIGACGPKSAANSGEPNGIACKGTKPVKDSGTTKPSVDSGKPDAGDAGTGTVVVDSGKD
jgi:hypothetical protein